MYQAIEHNTAARFLLDSLEYLFTIQTQFKPSTIFSTYLKLRDKRSRNATEIYSLISQTSLTQDIIEVRTSSKIVYGFKLNFYVKLAAFYGATEIYQNQLTLITIEDNKVKVPRILMMSAALKDSTLNFKYKLI